MVTAQVARTQLSRDLGDYFASTTTAIAASADKLVDTVLIDEDKDEFLQKTTSVWILGGQTGGPSSSEQRRIDRDNSTMTSGILDSHRDWSATLQASVAYEVHHLYTAAEKDDAINVALDLTPPIIWKSVVSDVTMVADQYDYDISSLSLRNDRIRSLHRVSISDTELTVPTQNWEIRDDKDLHIFFRPRATEKLRIRGIGNPAITDISQPQLLILTARAAMYLLSTALQGARVDHGARFQTLLQMNTQAYTERIRMHMKVAPSTQVQTEMLLGDRIDTDWRLP